MSSLKNYGYLIKNIKNWTLYFKRKYIKPTSNAIYITKGEPIKIEIPDNFFPVFKEIFMEDFYDINNLMKHIPTNANIVDIGANMGLFCFMIASKRKNAQIFAYEPMPQNTKLFEYNLLQNDSLKSRIHLNQKAVTGKPIDFIDLYFDDINSNTVIASVYQDFSGDNKANLKVPATTLEEIIKQNKLAKIDLLKLDCEGSEYPILYDSNPELLKLINCIALEVHDLDDNKRNSDYLQKFLTTHHFKIAKSVQANGCYLFIAYK